MKYCPNCGAEIHADESIKCPYCKTLYFDFSYIPFNEPFILTINTGTNDNPKLITNRVVLTSASIKTTTKYDSFPTIDMNFVALPSI